MLLPIFVKIYRLAQLTHPSSRLWRPQGKLTSLKIHDPLTNEVDQ